MSSQRQLKIVMKIVNELDRVTKIVQAHGGNLS